MSCHDGFTRGSTFWKRLEHNLQIQVSTFVHLVQSHSFHMVVPQLIVLENYSQLDMIGPSVFSLSKGFYKILSLAWFSPVKIGILNFFSSLGTIAYAEMARPEMSSLMWTHLKGKIS